MTDKWREETEVQRKEAAVWQEIAEKRKEERDALKEALEQLRGAWNVHMLTCEQHAALPIPTWQEIEAWRDAPSGTA